jgi:hypothetical protein
LGIAGIGVTGRCALKILGPFEVSYWIKKTGTSKGFVGNEKKKRTNQKIENSKKPGNLPKIGRRRGLFRRCPPRSGRCSPTWPTKPGDPSSLLQENSASALAVIGGRAKLASLPSLAGFLHLGADL